MATKQITKILIILACCTTIVKPLFASDDLKILTDINQQNNYLKAERLLGNPNSQRYKELYNKLHYYPLRPYLDQRRLIETMRLSSAGEISTFLDKYKDTPLDWPLRKPWLKYLTEKNKASMYVSFYKNTSNDFLRCQYLNFSLQLNKPANEIFNEVNNLWLTGKSLDKACDGVIRRWRKAGYLTPELVWQRIVLAADGGKHTLIPYLAGLLPSKDRYLGKLIHAVRKNPAVVTSKKRYKKMSAREAEIYTYGIKRYIWRDPDRAIKSYQSMEKKLPFTDEQKQQINEKFAIALASKNHAKAEDWLVKLHPSDRDKGVIQWQLTETLIKQNWPEALIKLEKMPDDYQSGLQWKYWYARALIGTGELERGQDVMTEIAANRHYYGFLAASYLATPVSLQDSPVAITPLEKKGILLYPAAKRAFEFYYLGRYIEARREWRYWLTQLSDREKLVAAKLANVNGWFDRAIFTLSQVGYLDDVELRFPRAFDKDINQQAIKHEINPAWAFAIARRESSFMTDARSPVGAKGLMQIMPNTAKQLKRGSVSRTYLYDAENNIKLGTKYLRKLLDKNKGNQVLATASYNAGPYRVKRWLKNTKSMPADIWIETIPFKETRNYVKSVLAYQEIYQHQPGEVSTIFNQVINMNIGN